MQQCKQSCVPVPSSDISKKRLDVLVGREGIFFLPDAFFPFVMAGSASLPGIVTYCHAPPTPHTGTVHPPMGARPLCKYRVMARAPACSREGPITPATAPSHRLVKIVRFPSFLFSLLSLFVSSSLRLHPLLFFFLSVSCYYSLYIPCLPIPLVLSCLSPSPRAGDLVELCTLCTVLIHVISVLFLIHLFH